MSGCPRIGPYRVSPTRLPTATFLEVATQVIPVRCAESASIRPARTWIVAYSNTPPRSEVRGCIRLFRVIRSLMLSGEPGGCSVGPASNLVGPGEAV